MGDTAAKQIEYLRTPRAIRERCTRVLELALMDRLPHFKVNTKLLPKVADYVVGVTLAAYPDLKIPVHSRWGHFDAGGVARNLELDERLAGLPRDEQARARCDLAVTSVLLDAGAGPLWSYHEAGTAGTTYGRSEGLAVASFRMFLAGRFSSDPAQPLRADAAGLRALTTEALATGFQVTEENPLVGVEGRLALLHGLAGALPRPGALYDQFAGRAQVPITEVFAAVMDQLGPIWPGRVTLDGVNLGDVWPYPLLSESSYPRQLVPFHKLSQWLTYSLIDPFNAGGIELTDLNELTCLPDYRNGGLLIDMDVLEPRSPRLHHETQKPWSEAIVEWRALTVALIDRLAVLVRERLGKSEAALPLGCILQGGTWSAGRAVAAERRPGGAPPILVDSDGTVF